MSKEDTHEGFHLFLKKYNKKIDDDIFINKFNHYNIAEYFFNINKNNYIYSKFKKDETFYYYNQQNILKEQAETFIYSKIKETIETKLNEIIHNYKKTNPLTAWLLILYSKKQNQPQIASPVCYCSSRKV